MRITVLGAGYLGATHAVCMAELGHEVVAIDTDEDKIASLAAGQAPFYEPGLAELLERGLKSGRLRFTTSYEEAGSFGDVHFICVGTPQQRDGRGADLTGVFSCAAELARYLRRRCLVVGRSTVPAGTAAKVAEVLATTAPAGRQVELAWTPEFLREGHAVQDTLRPDRIVLGVASRWAEGRLRGVFAEALGSGVPVLVTDYATAELVKVAANAFLATKVSFINAVAEVCDAVGADVVKLAEALSYDSRIGSEYLRPGLGFGGGCLPKDIRAFAARSEELGLAALDFLHDVDEINLRARSRLVDLVTSLVGGSLSGRRIAALGATFKAATDDVRESPALDVAAQLVAAGAEVAVYDPQGADNARRILPSARYASSALDAAADADAVLVLTDWPEFSTMDPAPLQAVVAVPRIVDGRHCLDSARWRAAGWSYYAPGRP
jgi:UDPglucose 6-dehydrogenase